MKLFMESAQNNDFRVTKKVKNSKQSNNFQLAIDFKVWIWDFKVNRNERKFQKFKI